MNTFYEQGWGDAFQELGLEKTSAVPGVGALGRGARAAGGWLKSKIPTWKGTKEFMVGNPRQFAEEIAAGKATSKGSLLRESFKVDSPYMKALLYGMPAVEAGSIAMDDEGRKAQRLGETLGGTALGLAAYRPFGLLGSMAADTLGRRLGAGIGQTADYVGRGGAPEPVPENPTAVGSAAGNTAETLKTLTPTTRLVGRAVNYATPRTTS